MPAVITIYVSKNKISAYNEIGEKFFTMNSFNTNNDFQYVAKNFVNAMEKKFKNKTCKYYISKNKFVKKMGEPTKKERENFIAWNVNGVYLLTKKKSPYFVIGIILFFIFCLGFFSKWYFNKK